MLNLLDQLKFTPKKLDIWPTNRNLKWHKIITNSWAKITIFSTVVYWSCNVIGVTIVIYSAVDRTKSNLLILEQEDKECSLNDLFELMALRIVAYFISIWYSDSSSLMRTSYLDQVEYVESINIQLQTISNELTNLSCNEISQPETVNERQANHLDEKLLKSYIRFQVFASEMKLMFQQVEQSVIFIYCSMLISILALVAFSHGDPKLRPLMYVSSLTVILVNIWLVPLAVLNSKCIALARLAYQMIAHAERINTDSMSSYHFCEHTLNLWRKFILHHGIYSEIFSCSMLGLAPLNYATILRLNFYILSLLILLLANLQI